MPDHQNKSTGASRGAGPWQSGVPGGSGGIPGISGDQIAGLADALQSLAGGSTGTPLRGELDAAPGGAGVPDRGEAVEYRGEGRLAGPDTERQPCTLRLDDTGLTVEMGGGRPVRAGYRDLSLIAIQQGTALLVAGDGPDAVRWLFERFGDKLGAIVRELRARRLRQQLSDALVQVPDDPFELVEFAWQPGVAASARTGPAGAATGVGQLVVHRWGFVVAPLDERVAAIRYRRAAITAARVPSPGIVAIDGEQGRLELRGLGAASTRFVERLTRLRDSAFDDASRFIELLLPDAPFGVRRRAGELLVDGRPTRPDELGDGWATVEEAVLREPTFAASYESLVTAAGPSAPRWLAISPEDPGSQKPKIWFLVALPGNLVAMELVSEGAHATYCFRVMPRASYRGEAPEAVGAAGEDCVRAISEALVDARFLREPMALPADQLRLPKYLRYRLALAALPTLAEARARFVARLVHSDPAKWNAALQDLIAWHAASRDDAEEWPGRAAQEKQVLAASGEGAVGGPDDSEAEAPAEAGAPAPADRSSSSSSVKPPKADRPSGTLG